jgi:hypothetical protein
MFLPRAYPMKCTTLMITWRPKIASFTLYGFLLLLVGVGGAGAYDLGPVGCGGEYGGLNLTFPNGVTKFSQIEQKLASLPSAKAKFSIPGEKPGTFEARTLYAEVKETFSRADNWVKNNITVPIGSEQFIAQSLTNAGVIKRAQFAKGFCGGAEISYAYVAKNDAVGDLTQSKNFEGYLSTVLQSYVQTKGSMGVFDEGPLVVSPIEPYYPLKRYTVVVPSEVSRGPQAKGTWDRFDAIFALYKSTTQEFLVVVHTENLRIAPKVAVHNTPPSVEHFRPVGDKDMAAYQAEYVVAASIAKFMAGSSAKCKVETVGFSAVSEGPIRCTHP